MLLSTVDELRSLLAPIREGRITRAAFDTETSEVRDGRFTPWGTDVRIAGFSVSYGSDVDLYVPIRHRPYDWRRRPHLLERDTKHEGAKWLRRLLEVERVRPWSDEDDWEAGWQDGADPNLPLGLALELLAEAMAAPSCRWVAHNWPFDAKQLQVDGIEPPWERLEDTQALSVFTDERPHDRWDEEAGEFLHQGHALKHLGELYLGVPPSEQAELEQAKSALGRGSSKLQDYSQLPLRSCIAPYGCQDTRLALGLFEFMLTRDAAKDERAMALYQKHLAEIRISTGMERYGIGVDTEETPKAVASQEKLTAELAAKCASLAGRALPLNHGPQLSDVLYNELLLPVYAPNGRELRNTRKATLKKIRARLAGGMDCTGPGGIGTDDAVELLDSILEYRKQNKLLTAFYQPLGDFTSEGRVHYVLSPLAARTTRYSASAPNMQQAPKPKKGKEHESPRRLFKPRPGHCFVLLDYSQIEMRLAGHYSYAIPEAFQYVFSWRCTLKRRGDCKGRGKHGSQEVHYGWRPNYSVRPEHLRLYEGFWNSSEFDPYQQFAGDASVYRDTGKTSVLALLYGAWFVKLAETLDCDVSEARRLFDVFWRESYPELERVKQFIGERLRRGGKPTHWSGELFVRTLHGARVYLDGGHKGLNYLIQRSAREILLQAILDVDAYTREHAPSYKLVLPIHDELMLEVPKADLCKEHVQNIARIMVEAGSKSTVPMVVQPDVAYEDWAHKEELPKDWGWDGVEVAKAARAAA